MDASMCLLQARPLSTEVPPTPPSLSLSPLPSLSLSLSKPSIWPRSSVHLTRSLYPPAALRRMQHRPQLPPPLLAMANDAIAATAVASSRKSIAQTFSDLKQQGKVALIPYLTAGDPDLSTTAKAIKVLDDNGADIIELGVPYSDPLADGPVIQAAATRALHNGADLDHILEMLTKVVPNLRAPVVLFTYYNPILKRGANEFIQTIKQVGVTGLVVPDLPLEETELLRKLTAENNLELVLLTTPTTPIGRMKQIAEASQGFVYLVSLTGVTGARASVEARVEGLLQELKKATEKPVAVGFGISKPEHAAQMAKWGADGVIVGSAMVKILYEASSPQEGLAALKIFTRDLKAALP